MNLDFDTLITDADPARDAAIPSAWSADARWRYNQLTHQNSRPAKRKHHLVLLTSVGAPTAIALSLLLVNVLPLGQRSAAAAMLERAAAAAGQRAVQLAPGQYLYTETQSAYQVTLYKVGATSDKLAEVAQGQFNATEQVWIGSDNSGRFIQNNSPLTFSSPADEAAWNADPFGSQMSQNIESYGQNVSQPRTEQSLSDVSKLPTDPNTLASVIAKGGTGTNVDLIPSGPNATFDRAASLLIGPNVGMTPALARALFEVLAAQPGVQLVGTVTDHNGQQGQAVVLSTANGTDVSEIIVDPNTGSLLEAQFAVPSATSPTGICARIGTSSSVPCFSSTGEAVMATMWTDVISTGVVNSDTST
ncbi:MAG: CU044_5270 family protein [Acidimicrobiales bacterium]|jgi:hypothetical protein